MGHKQVLLREDIDNLGARGEIVRVKAGYARNYLLPRSLAVEATASNVKQIESERAALLKREAKERSSADGQADQLRGMTELRELNLYRTRITNAGLERLKAMKHLAALDLRYTRATRAGIDSLRGKLPACRVTFLDSSVERAGKPLEGGSLSGWVSSLGGKITLESQVNEGSVFTLQVPARLRRGR